MHLYADPSPVRTLPYAKVALPVPIATFFTYDIPSNLAGQVAVGSRVDVPFGRRVLSGIVVELADATDVAKTKPIQSVYDTYLTPDLLKLTEWIASYYGCSIGEAAQAVLPPALKPTRQRPQMRGAVRLRDNFDHSVVARELRRSHRQLDLVEALVEAGGQLEIGVAIGELGFKTEQIKSLLSKHIVEHIEARRTSSFDTIEEVVTRLTAGRRNWRWR